MMVGKLVASDDVEVFRVREQQHLGQIDHLHRVIADLDARLKGLGIRFFSQTNNIEKLWELSTKKEKPVNKIKYPTISRLKS